MPLVEESEIQEKQWVNFMPLVFFYNIPWKHEEAKGFRGIERPVARNGLNFINGWNLGTSSLNYAT